MRVVLLGATLATFVIFSRTHEPWCNVCPGAPTTEDNNSSCICEKDFYDPSTETCVGYFDCPLFKSLLTRSVKSLVSASVTTFTSSVVTSGVELLAEGTLDLLIPNVTNTMEDLASTILESSRDIDIINSIVKRRLVKESNNITSRFSILSNPYLIRNNKLLGVCENNTMCVVQKIMQRNMKKSQNATAAMVEEVVDQLILSLNDIRDYEKSNCKDGCPIIKILVKYKDLVVEMLASLKHNNVSLGTSVVRALVNMKPVENETFNKILSNIGVGNI